MSSSIPTIRRRTDQADPIDQQAAVHYLAKLRLSNIGNLSTLTGGRIWHPHEITPNPIWPFVIIAGAKVAAGGVQLSVEAWGRWPIETAAMASMINDALPMFSAAGENLYRPDGCPAGAAVACLTFERAFSND